TGQSLHPRWISRNYAIAVSDLRTDVPIRIKTTARKSKPERVWAFIKGALDTVVAIAVVGYTVVASKTGKNRLTPTNMCERQTELSRKALNETLKNLRTEERPWI